jgi:cell wall-associated NlpC family hydrolase
MRVSRLTPANDRVAHESLSEELTGVTFTKGTWRRVALGTVDLLRRPNGPRDRQLLFGDRVLMLEDRDGVAFVQSQKDGYVGYVPRASLATDTSPTHWVKTLGTHLYPSPDFKQKQHASLSFGALVTVIDTTGRFAQCDTGDFVPHAHLSPISERPRDFVASAQLFLGTPYLWGGNSRDGIDCSGLVQGALLGSGHNCPADSDMQETIGSDIPQNSALKRGDLLFWKGHVAMVFDETRLIHANAHHMAVAFENIDDAIDRIQSQGDGPVTARRRLTL